MKKYFAVFNKYLYVITMILFSTAAGIFLSVLLIGIVTHPDSHEKKDAISEDFQQILSQTDKEVTRHMGDMGFSEPKLKGHFHHIGKWYENDTWNFCIECHGSIPHSKSAENRSFLNMHTLFVSCQVCHVPLLESEKTDTEGRYGWIDIKKGELQKSPDMVNAVPGEYGVKIIQLSGTGSNPKPLYMQKERKFYEEFKLREKDLNETQKGITNKILHERCAEKPMECNKCHTTESPLLNFSELGYTEDRNNYLMNLEVVDLVQRAENFYIPTLLDGKTIDTATSKVMP